MHAKKSLSLLTRVPLPAVPLSVADGLPALGVGLDVDGSGSLDAGVGAVRGGGHGDGGEGSRDGSELEEHLGGWLRGWVGEVGWEAWKDWHECVESRREWFDEERIGEVERAKWSALYTFRGWDVVKVLKGR